MTDMVSKLIYLEKQLSRLVMYFEKTKRVEDFSQMI